MAGFRSAGGASLGSSEMVIRGPRTPERPPVSVPVEHPVARHHTPGNGRTAGAASETIVRRVSTVKRPGKYYPDAAGEPEFPIQSAGGLSDMEVKKLIGDDPHELRRKELEGRLPAWKRRKQR